MLGFGEIAEKLRRSTVQIHPHGRRGGQGSGVIWSARGLILTNAHVARAAEAETAALGEIDREARILSGYDPASGSGRCGSLRSDLLRRILDNQPGSRISA